MKNLILAICLLLSTRVFSTVIVVSDIDDTIKQSDVLNTLDMIQNYAKPKAFPHMASLFTSLEKYYAKDKELVKFYYVSGSYKCISPQINWLKKHHFPVGDITQKNCIAGKNPPNMNTAHYKRKVINEIIKKYESEADVKFFMFGDNASYDAIVYKDLKLIYPQLTINAYIRDIATKAFHFSPNLPTAEQVPGINYFLTEKDLVKFSSLEFIDQKYIEAVDADLRDGKLFPDYLHKTLGKRLYKEAHIRKKYSKKQAKAILQNYY